MIHPKHFEIADIQYWVGTPLNGYKFSWLDPMALKSVVMHITDRFYEFYHLENAVDRYDVAPWNGGKSGKMVKEIALEHPLVAWFGDALAEAIHQEVTKQFIALEKQAEKEARERV